jgi:predicted kinase
MAKVLILKGLPASGKSSRAKELVKQGWTRVNRDDLRAMLHSSEWSSDNEKLVVKLRDTVIEECLEKGRNVVVDDTNLAVQNEKQIRQIALKYNAEVGCQFFDTPLKECIERDSKREDVAQVGEQVIRRMYNKYLSKNKNFKVENPLEIEDFEEDKVEWIEGLPTAIICDIDGTLAHMCDRSPYDYKACIGDALCAPVADLLARYNPFHCLDTDPATVILLSGRDEMCRPETETWLGVYDIAYDVLYMRPEGDQRKDRIVKKEIFDREIRGKYNVLFVLDDRNQVVDMWRELGLTCYQVAPGNF